MPKIENTNLGLITKYSLNKTGKNIIMIKNKNFKGKLSYFLLLRHKIFEKSFSQKVFFSNFIGLNRFWPERLNAHVNVF
jgi:hypothetical protein